jgi:hypothetical protein
MWNVKPTDLIHHSINLKLHIVLKRVKIGWYSQHEQDYAVRIFPEIEETGILVRESSE